jgi:hypothetical protein
VSSGPSSNVERKPSAVLALLDQGLSSVTNLGSSVAAALMLSRDEFGKFAIVYLVYATIVPGIQAVLGQELVLEGGSQKDRIRRARNSMKGAVLLGSAAAGILAIVALVVPEIRNPMFALALFMPLLQAQDTGRYAAAVVGRLGIAVMSDIVWLFAFLGALAVAVSLGRADSPSSLIIVWAFGAAVGLLVPVLALRSPGAPAASAENLLSRHHLGYRFLAEYIVVRASSQILYILLGVFAGAAATGGLRGATTLVGPLSVFLLAGSSFGVPLLKSVAANRRDWILAAAGILVALAFSCVILILVSLPDSAGTFILGDTWEGAKQYLPPVGVQTICSVVSVTGVMALRVVKPRLTLVLGSVSAFTLPIMYGIGYLIGGPVGAVWGIAVAAGIQGALMWSAYGVLRSRGNGLSRVP